MQAVLDCKTREDADQLISTELNCVCAQKDAPSPEEAKRILLCTIGYLAYFYDGRTIDRILGLFQTEHPFFGKSHPSGKMAFTMGSQYARLTRSRTGRAKADAFFRSGDYDGLRAWLMEDQ
jgi:hypothetical protein